MSEQQQGSWADLQGSQQGSWADLTPQQSAPSSLSPAEVAMQIAKTKAGMATQKQYASAQEQGQTPAPSEAGLGWRTLDTIMNTTRPQGTLNPYVPPASSDFSALSRVPASFIANAPESMMSGAAAIRSAVSKGTSDIPLSVTQALRALLRPAGKIVAGGMESTAQMIKNDGSPLDAALMRIQKAMADQRAAFPGWEPGAAKLPEASIGGSPRPGVPAYIDQQLAAGRDVETPEQLYERMKQMRDAQLPQSQLGESPKLNTPRPVSPSVASLGEFASVTPETSIERIIAPSGNEAKATTMQIAPKLAQNPALAAAAATKNPAVFDKLVHAEYQSAKAGLDAAEKLVPPTATVAKAPVLEKIDAAIEKLKVPTGTRVSSSVESPILDASGRPITSEISSEGYVSGHEDALKLLKAERARIEQFPDQIPWADARKYRVQLDKAIQTSNGWSETASAADRATMQAKRLVANSVRQGLSDAAPMMKEANAKFALMQDTINALKMDTTTGRRIAEVGKIPKK